jgi:hypothetical protein
MASISTLRTEIAENLATITGLRVSPTGQIPDNVNPPYAIVTPTSVDYHKAFNNGLNTYNFTITVVVGRASERSAQNTLDAYCSPTGTQSIKGAVESDRTLDGTAYSLIVTGMRNYGSITIAETNYLAAEFDLTVQAD